MYLITQLWTYLAVAFLLGALPGYWLWSLCSRRKGVAPSAAAATTGGKAGTAAVAAASAAAATAASAAASRIGGVHDEDAAAARTARLIAEHQETIDQLTRENDARLAAERKKHDAELTELRRRADDAARKHAGDLKSVASKTESQAQGHLAASTQKLEAELADVKSQLAKAKASDDDLARLRRPLEGNTSASEAAGQRPNLLYAPRGGKADDLTLISGLPERYERQLNALGVYHYDQVATWTERDTAWLSGHIAGFDERATKDNWIAQAGKLAGGGRPGSSAATAASAKTTTASAHASANASTGAPQRSASPASGGPERLARPRNGAADDLKLIWGVGQDLEKKLNELGIWHFDQIAHWSSADEAWASQALGNAASRMGRDKWVEQCKKLAGGWRPKTEAGERPS